MVTREEIIRLAMEFQEINRIPVLENEPWYISVNDELPIMVMGNLLRESVTESGLIRDKAMIRVERENAITPFLNQYKELKLHGRNVTISVRPQLGLFQIIDKETYGD
jgi:hypothetical protein